MQMIQRKRLFEDQKIGKPLLLGSSKEALGAQMKALGTGRLIVGRKRESLSCAKPEGVESSWHKDGRIGGRRKSLPPLPRPNPRVLPS